MIDPNANPPTPAAEIVAGATETALGPTLMLSGLGKPGSPLLKQWYAIRSKRTGKYVLDGYRQADDGQLEWDGGVVAFFDKDDAERRASSLREDFPLQLFDVVSLPSSPPDVVYPSLHNDSAVAAAFITIARGNEIVRIELRPETLSHSMALLALLNSIVEHAARKIPGARMSPVTLLAVGPSPVQVSPDTLPATAGIPAPESDQEAA